MGDATTTLTDAGGYGLTVGVIVGNGSGGNSYGERVDKITVCNVSRQPKSTSHMYWSMHSMSGIKYSGSATHFGLYGTELNPGECVHNNITFKVPTGVVQKYITISFNGTPRVYLPISK